MQRTSATSLSISSFLVTRLQTSVKKKHRNSPRSYSSIPARRGNLEKCLTEIPRGPSTCLTLSQIESRTMKFSSIR